MTDSKTPGISNGDEFDELEVIDAQFAQDTAEIEIAPEELAPAQAEAPADPDEAAVPEEPGTSGSWSLSRDFSEGEHQPAPQDEPFWLQDADDATQVSDFDDEVEVIGVEHAQETGLFAGTPAPAAGIDTNAIEIVEVQHPLSVPEPPASVEPVAPDEPFEPAEPIAPAASGDEEADAVDADDAADGPGHEFDPAVGPDATAGDEQAAGQAPPAAEEVATWGQLETGEIHVDPIALGQARAQFESMQQNVTAEQGRLQVSEPIAPVPADAELSAPAGQPAVHGAPQLAPAPQRAALEAANPAPESPRPQTRAEVDATQIERQAILHPREPDTDDELAQAAINRVRSWLGQRDPRVRRDPDAARLAALLADPAGLQFAIRFIDRVVRPENPQVSAREFERLSRTVPDFLDWYLKFGISLGGGLGVVAPRMVIPLAKRALRRQLSHMIVDATPERLGRRLQKLASDGTRLNIRLLGEAVLGEQEAQRQLDSTLQLLARPDVDSISITLSTFAPQLQLWGFDEAVERLVQRLTPLYSLAASAPEQKRITLEMEQYAQLDLTVAVFQRILSNPELRGLEAGITLQGYHPDALGTLGRITEWARARTAAGGAGIAIRLVKGTSLAGERVEAALRGWPLATTQSRTGTDANFKRVLRFAMLPENAGIVRVGVASHNLFDLAYAIELAQRTGVTDRVDIEMLRGMESEYLDAIRREIPRLTLYTPVVHPRDFDAAIAYLVRRLEENGSSENFARRSADLGTSLAAFELERDRFLASVELMVDEDAAGGPLPNRRQDRSGALSVAVADASSRDAFFNEPDTDPALSANREWAARVLERATTSELGQGTLSRNLIDDMPTMERRIRKIIDAAPAWRDRGADERRRTLWDAAVTLGAYRGRLVEVMASETGRTIGRADAEVSEAIDFCRHYGDGTVALEQLEHAKPKPVDLTVVVSSWRAPAASPASGIAAALATGSTVIVKPARSARRTAAVLVEALWEAGVPRDVLVLCDIEDREIARRLIAHEAVGRVLLTGAVETAEQFATWRPGIPLLAETGGKNAIVVTPAADFDLAVDDLVHSAFADAGQQSSSASVAILVGSVARSERFRRQLVDAVQSLRVAYPTDPSAHVGPLVEPVHGSLERALTTLEAGESWLVEPRRLDDSGRLWSPGVRIGVQPGSYTHLTEFTGPHLSLIEVPTLADAIEVQNTTDSALAAGIHSLDGEQVAEWLDRVEAGSLYVNRRITGAIVRRQPSGGWKLSQIGPGAKAGGPNRLAALVDWEPVFERPRDTVRLVGLARQVASVIESATPQLDFLEFDRVRAGANSDQRAWEQEFGRARDVAKLGVERNVLRYRAADDVLVRLPESGTTGQLMRVLAAAARAGADIRISSARDLPPHLEALIGLDEPPLWVDQTVVESDEEFHARVISGAALAPLTSTDAAEQERAGSPVRRIRLAGDDPGLADALAGNVRVALYDGPVSTEGRLELLPFLREQTVSMTAHRFGTPDEELLDLPL